MDDNTERKQTLRTGMDLAQRNKYQARIDQRLRDAFENREEAVKQSRDRFARAIEEGWTIRHAVATSGAHGWQIESDDDGLRLSEGAYPGDVSWLVFENGWIHRTGARWLKDDDLAAWVRRKKDSQEAITERLREKEREAFEADDRIRYAVDTTGEKMPGWWVFRPTGYTGTPRHVVAYAAGYDARQGGEEE